MKKILIGLVFCVVGLGSSGFLARAIFSNDIFALRRVKDVTQDNFVLMEVPAEKYIASSIVENLMAMSGMMVGAKDLDNLVGKIRIHADAIRTIVAERFMGKINVSGIIGLVDGIIRQLQESGIKVRPLDYNGKLLVAEDISEAIFEIGPENIFLVDGRNYFFHVYVEKEAVQMPFLLEERPKTWEQTMAFYERYGIARLNIEKYKQSRSDFLQIADPRVVLYRMERLQQFFNERSAKFIDVKRYPILAARGVSHVINRAKVLDRLTEEKGLKLSYRYGRGIEKTDPEILLYGAVTIEENLQILQENGIDHVLRSNLLYLSIFHLKTNVNFLKQVIALEKESGVDMVKNAYLLAQPILTLQNNYTLLKVLGAEIKPSYLNYRMTEMIERLNQGKLKIAGVSFEQIRKLTDNLSAMLEGQREFFDWYIGADAAEEEKEARRILNMQRGKASVLYNIYGLNKLDMPAYSLFSLMTYINLTKPRGQAIMEFAGIALKEPQSIERLIRKGQIAREEFDRLVDELQKKYGLNDEDKFYLEAVIDKEIKQFLNNR